MNFADALEITPELAKKIDLLIGKKVKIQKPLSPTILEKIVEAGKKSTAITENFKKYL